MKNMLVSALRALALLTLISLSQPAFGQTQKFDFTFPDNGAPGNWEDASKWKQGEVNLSNSTLPLRSGTTVKL